MPIFNFFRNNPLKNIDLSRLKIREKELRLKSSNLIDDIEKIEKEYRAVLERSKTAKSRLEDISLANTMKSLGNKKIAKVEAHSQIEKELRAISNLIITKELEADLKARGTWDALQKLPPEVVEKYLIDMELDKQDRANRIKSITNITTESLKTTAKLEEGLEEELAAIEAVKEGTLTPEAATERLTKEKITEG